MGENVMRGKWKWMLVLAEVTGILLGAASCTGAGEPCRGILYRVTGGKNEMMILGSIHVGNERMTHFGGTLQQALREADCFVFECDTASQEAQTGITEMMAAEQPLDGLLTAETYALLEQTAQKCGIAMNRLNALRPWAVTSALSSQAAAAELGTRNARSALRQGVEERVQTYVGEKQVYYLETAREQLEVLDGFSPALQDAMVRSICQQILNPEEAGSTLSQWPDWWAEGKTEPFIQAYEAENDFAEPALTEEYRWGLITLRNRRMAEGLRVLLEQDEGEKIFATVGLLHLVLPEESVLRELEAMGYQVEQVKE